MSNAMYGHLGPTSFWVQFLDREGVTRIQLRRNCKRWPEDERAVMVDGDVRADQPAAPKVIFTELTFDEIMEGKK